MWPRILKIAPHTRSLLSAFEKANPRMRGGSYFPGLLLIVGYMDLYDCDRALEAYRPTSKAEKALETLSMPLETAATSMIYTLGESVFPG